MGVAPGHHSRVACSPLGERLACGHESFQQNGSRDGGGSGIGAGCAMDLPGRMPGCHRGAGCAKAAKSRRRLRGDAQAQNASRGRRRPRERCGAFPLGRSRAGQGRYLGQLRRRQHAQAVDPRAGPRGVGPVDVDQRDRRLQLHPRSSAANERSPRRPDREHQFDLGRSGGPSGGVAYTPRSSPWRPWESPWPRKSATSASA